MRSSTASAKSLGLYLGTNLFAPTAATLLTAKSAKLEKQLAKVANDKAATAKLNKDIAKTKKLVAALAAANDGLTSYLTKTGEDA